MERDDTSYLTDRVTHETGRGDPFAAAMRATRTPMVITDPRQADNPIVFANDAFLSSTGYDREDVMGINCRFLQGPDTDRTSIRDIAEAIKLKTDISIDVLNYRKDGSSFWNALYISPVFNKANDLQYFFASQVDITERQDALAAKTVLVHEVDHRVNNNLQMIAAIIILQANSIADSVARRSLETMLTRIEAVSMVHRCLYQSDDVTRCSVSEFVTDIVTELVAVTGRTDIRVRFELEPVDVSAERAAPLALIVNELVTNVLKHALPADRSGNVAVIVKRNEATFRVTIEDDGVGMSAQPPASTRSFGQNLVRMLTRQLRASVTWSDAEPTGTRVVVDLPIEPQAPRSDHGKPAAFPLRRG